MTPQIVRRFICSWNGSSSQVPTLASTRRHQEPTGVCLLDHFSQRIPTRTFPLNFANADEEIREFETEDVKMSTGKLHNNLEEVQTSGLGQAMQTVVHALYPVHTQMCFELTSWCFDDYEKAFRNVVSNFPSYQKQSNPAEETAERIKLLQEKYFVAGGSARLMFDFTTTKAIKILDKAITEAPNIESDLQGFVGASSSGAWQPFTCTV
ncbi:unnamed protein product [Phytophthora lilii]|uniref:Unnamed protein product n=1 Tax=Phytophthora lilii TaxID=2077276 RepID=A0A9W6UE03_9STRA|nr:unnamed protein product [Phytophthora lilii]